MKKVSVRVKQHVSVVKNEHVSMTTVCEHTVDKPSHYIRFDKSQIAQVNKYIPRMIREATEIKKITLLQ